MTNLEDFGLYTFKGTITKVNSGMCELELDGRMGRISVPIRLIVSQSNVKEGDCVELKLSPIIVKGGTKTS
ncbi:hypothetical protein [Natranaerobius trueperi]|uniref:S1 motif domain-containing protein n=1 Tax=Natranaerobius trueperi TaxID=759412 RepID=A0A226C1T1_9FIRM|nr:hypothetical protein [Natranaerobius trueperi]OWZ84330.1 hypothetical protein CDO51_03440 [Natranaerobius trueperi]